jgi:hypothetical protein
MVDNRGVPSLSDTRNGAGEPSAARVVLAVPQRADHPDPRRNLYALTADGLRFAIFYTKVHDSVLRPLMAADQPRAPAPLRAGLRVIHGEVTPLHRRYPAASSRLTSHDVKVLAAKRG